MSEHNCRIGKSTYIYPGYMFNVDKHIREANKSYIDINAKFIAHLISSGKTCRLL
jgi:hypothetical protein